MSNEWLEKLARSLAGETLSSGAAGLGAGIGYKMGGGQWSDIPDVIREEIEAFKRRTQPKSKAEQDALEVVMGLSAISNPLSAVGHGVDFVTAAPEMLQPKLSNAEPRTGKIMLGGLKRRLAKGGAQAEYALKQRAARINDVTNDVTKTGANKAEHFNLPQPVGGYNYQSKMSNSAVNALSRADRPSKILSELSESDAKFAKYLDAKKLNAPMEYHHTANMSLSPFYDVQILQQLKDALPKVYEKSQKSLRPRKEKFAEIAKENKNEFGIEILKSKQRDRAFDKIFADPELRKQYDLIDAAHDRKNYETYLKFKHIHDYYKNPDYLQELKNNSHARNEFIKSIKP